MPKVREFVPLTPEELAGIRRKQKREEGRKNAREQRQEDRIAYRNISKLKTEDSSISGSRCRVCGAKVCFDVCKRTGLLILLNIIDRSLHPCEGG